MTGNEKESDGVEPRAPAGWYPDFDHARSLRYWDGAAWTEHRAFEAGWYPDPDHDPTLRYWDGAAWTDHRAPVRPLRSLSPRWRAVVVTLLATALVSVVGLGLGGWGVVLLFFAPPTGLFLALIFAVLLPSWGAAVTWQREQATGTHELPGSVVLAIVVAAVAAVIMAAHTYEVWGSLTSSAPSLLSVAAIGLGALLVVAAPLVYLYRRQGSR